MLTNVPLMIVPLVIYNIVSFGLIGSLGSDPWGIEVLNVDMISGANWVMTLGELMITLGLVLLFVEIMKSTRTGANSIIDHLFSTFIFIAYLVEFLIVKSAVHPVFFILMIITLVDVLAGFSVTIRSASRDVSVNGGHF